MAFPFDFPGLPESIALGDRMRPPGGQPLIGWNHLPVDEPPHSPDDVAWGSLPQRRRSRVISVPCSGSFLASVGAICEVGFFASTDRYACLFSDSIELNTGQIEQGDDGPVRRREVVDQGLELPVIEGVPASPKRANRSSTRAPAGVPARAAFDAVPFLATLRAMVWSHAGSLPGSFRSSRRLQARMNASCAASSTSSGSPRRDETVRTTLAQCLSTSRRKAS